MLTVPETIGAVYARYAEKTPFNLYRLANPDAKPYLHAILQDPQQERYHEVVWQILGYIGDESDLSNMDKFIHELIGPLTLDQTHTLAGIFDCLGLMCGRKVPAALALAKDMEFCEYWKDVRFQWFAKPIPGRLPFEYESIMRLMTGLSLSRAPDLKEQIESVLNRIEDPIVRKEVGRAIAFKYLTSRARAVRTHEQDPVTSDERREVSSLFNGDFRHPGPSERVLGDEGRLLPEGLSDEELAKLAFDAFLKIGGYLLHNDFGSFMDHVDDQDGRIKEDSSGVGLRGNLLASRDFLQGVWSTKPRAGNFQVAKHRMILEPGTAKRNVIFVTFELVGTAKPASQLRSTQTQPSPVAEDGNLLVRMKHVDGRWYWHPFGW
jgi:hypothetical protein